MNTCEKNGEECTLYAFGDTLVSGMSPAELMAVAEKYYLSVSPGQAQMNEDHLVGVRISSKEITALLSDKSVTGRNHNVMAYRGIWQSDGVIKAEVTNLGHIKRAPADVGTWTVEDGKLCPQQYIISTLLKCGLHLSVWQDL